MAMTMLPGPRMMSHPPPGFMPRAGPGPMPRGPMSMPPPSGPGGPRQMDSKNQYAASVSAAFDGKHLRKAILRRTIDYNSSMIHYMENRLWQRDHRDLRAIQTDQLYEGNTHPPIGHLDNPMNCVTTKFIRTSTNKIKCPIFCVVWTPEGRRLVTGASSGEFTLWNGLTFNFETILQAHDVAIRSMIWSHNDLWMLTGDHGGFVKYWQSNMNNVKMFQAHKDPIRGISFCPTDQKFATCSDDGTVRIWDFTRCYEEKILRGHGADVKCLDWHPQKALLVSGSKDAQQPLKLWDPRTGNSLATIHAHKHTVMEVKWNKNGNWMLTASRDHLVKLFDIRNMKEEIQVFKGHKKEATTVAWHPIHENFFASGGSDGALMFWMAGTDKEVGSMDEAHDMMVWSLAWHPMGHILASGSNDHSTRFWTRNRPGDCMRDKFNLNTLPLGMEDMLEDGDLAGHSLPGMGLEHGLPEHLMQPKQEPPKPKEEPSIPGLDSLYPQDKSHRKKVPYARPIPRQFEQAWSTGVKPSLGTDGGVNNVLPGKGPPSLLNQQDAQASPGQQQSDGDSSNSNNRDNNKPGPLLEGPRSQGSRSNQGQLMQGQFGQGSGPPNQGQFMSSPNKHQFMKKEQQGSNQFIQGEGQGDPNMGKFRPGMTPEGQGHRMQGPGAPSQGLLQHPNHQGMPSEGPGFQKAQSRDQRSDGHSGNFSDNFSKDTDFRRGSSSEQDMNPRDNSRFGGSDWGRGRGRGRGRGGHDRGGHDDHGTPSSRPPSLLDMPMIEKPSLKRQWDQGPGRNTMEAEESSFRSESSNRSGFDEPSRDRDMRNENFPPSGGRGRGGGFGGFGHRHGGHQDQDNYGMEGGMDSPNYDGFRDSPGSGNDFAVRGRGGGPPRGMFRGGRGGPMGPPRGPRPPFLSMRGGRGR